MPRDLAGQALLFPEEAEAAGGAQAACGGRAADVLGLPGKATCTVGEAHRYTGISERQLRYFVADGTLLAINVARVPVARDAERGGARRRGKLDRWRIVVRRHGAFMEDGYRHFLTLEEFLASRANKEG